MPDNTATSAPSSRKSTTAFFVAYTSLFMFLVAINNWGSPSNPFEGKHEHAIKLVILTAASICTITYTKLIKLGDENNILSLFLKIIFHISGGMVVGFLLLVVVGYNIGFFFISLFLILFVLALFPGSHHGSLIRSTWRISLAENAVEAQVSRIQMVDIESVPETEEEVSGVQTVAIEALAVTLIENE